MAVALHFARDLMYNTSRGAALLKLTGVGRGWLDLHTSSYLLKKSKEGSLVIRRRGEFLYGVSPCLAALQASRRKIHAIYMKPGTAQKQGAVKTLVQKDVWEMAKKKKVEIHHVDKNVLERLSGRRPHQGIVIDADPLNYRRMDEREYKIESSKIGKSPLWLALDEIHDPMNLGAIIRCAYFLGVDKLITSAKKCCPLTPVVSKASSGAMEIMPVFAVSGMLNFLLEAKEKGWTVLGTVGRERSREKGTKVTGTEEEEEEEVKGERTVKEGEEEERRLKEEGRGETRKKKKLVVDCNQYSMDGPTIVVLGNEGYGLHSSVEKACTALLTVAPRRELPQAFDSLNVAVATGIILHTLQNKYIQSHKKG